MKYDLTKIGHDENIVYEVSHKDEIKYPEAFIDGEPFTDYQDPIPDWLPPTGKKRSLLGYFNLLLV